MGRGEITDLFTIGKLGGSFGSAFHLNEKGHVIGISSLPGDRSFHAVSWREHRFTDLGTLPGDACSEPFFISSRDQVLGISADCNFDLTTMHAFLWEDGEMVDLNMLIPADSGIELQGAAWMNESGEIAVQGVLTDSGDERAVLLVPDGDCDHECEAAVLAAEQAAATSSNGVKSSTLSPQTRAQLRQPGLKHN